MRIPLSANCLDDSWFSAVPRLSSCSVPLDWCVLPHTVVWWSSRGMEFERPSKSWPGMQLDQQQTRREQVQYKPLVLHSVFLLHLLSLQLLSADLHSLGPQAKTSSLAFCFDSHSLSAFRSFCTDTRLIRLIHTLTRPHNEVWTRRCHGAGWLCRRPKCLAHDRHS